MRNTGQDWKEIGGDGKKKEQGDENNRNSKGGEGEN